MFPAISSCFSSSPTGIAFYLQHTAESCLSSQRESAQGNEKQGEERLGVGSAAGPCSASCPLPWHLPQPLLDKPPGRTLEAADKNHLGEEIRLLPAMWQVHEEEGAVQIPPLTIPSGCTIPQRLWHKGSHRDQTTFLTVINNKTNLQWVV